MIGTILLSALLVIAMVGLTGLYVMGEFATVGARKVRIIQMAESGDNLARMLRPVLEHPEQLDRYIAASQVGITLSSIVLGIYGQQQIAAMLAPALEGLPLLGSGSGGAAQGTAALIVLLFLTTLQVVFGELVPKSLAIQYPERMALATVVPMKISADYLLRPLIALLNGSGVILLKLLGVDRQSEHAHVHSPEEIVILVQESHRSGLLDADERRMLRSVFRVSETTSGEVAVPRNRMVAAEVSSPLTDVLALAANSAYTRIPIYEEEIDSILGYLHLKDLYTLYLTDPQASVRQIIRPAPFVPETLNALELWNRLNQEDSYLAIVFDEYGGISGMVTREDLIEELFGEVQDEFDQETALISQQGEGRVVVRGDMSLNTLNDMLDLDLPHEVYHTVGGLVQTELGRIPIVGDEVQVSDVRLKVEAVAGNTINSVSVELPPNAAQYQGEDGPS